MTDPVALTVVEAASALGITADAVRKRIKRGLLRAEKHADGSWVVYLDGPVGPATHSDRPTSYADATTRAYVALLERSLERERDRADDAEGRVRMLEAERIELTRLLLPAPEAERHPAPQAERQARSRRWRFW